MNRSNTAQHERTSGRAHAGILWCTERSISRSAVGELVCALAAIAGGYESLSSICMPLPRPAELD